MKLRLVQPPEPAGAEASEGGFRYWAFLSYSHHDRAIAKRLQKQLETYRVPRRLVGREGAHGAVPPRLAPVFRDRDELHAGSDLKASVQEALSSSRWLIVVCTPDAARSPWVNREIVEFKKLHGERRVLALIAHGEPFASDMPGREAQECFPPALRRALTPEGQPEGEPLEPIAADLRKHGDGPHRAMLKLVAGMLGVPFDDLVRRDVQRRVRWLTALAASSVVGVVVFAFLAVMAVQARNEAQYQRQQAEGLIEFMLGDLRKKLEPVGRLEVLDSVGEKALAYYGGQDAATLDANALGHRSRAMHLIGEIRDLRGQAAEAQEAFEQAALTTAKLLAKSPTDEQRIFDHAQSVFWVGYAAWKRTDGPAAEAKFGEYLALAERLTQKDPKNADWSAEVAFAHGNLGMVHLGMGNPEAALQSLSTAADGLTRLLPGRPELRFELAQTYGWMANALELQGDYLRALDVQRRKLSLFRALPDADKSRVAQRGMLNSLNPISQYELALGRIDEAEAAAQEARVLADVLVSEDPGNLRWKADACFVRLRLVELKIARGQAADVAHADAAQCVREFNAAGTRGPRDTLLLNGRALWLAMMMAPPSQGAELADEAGKFLDAHQPAIVRGTPDAFDFAHEIARVALALGDVLARDDEAGAKVAWRRGMEILKPFSHLQDGALLTTLAALHQRLGDTRAAQALVQRVQQASYRHPDYTRLLKQLQTHVGRSQN